jgi:hypothetical protein
VKLLLVDTSDRGGITVNTDLVARQLLSAGARPELLANRALDGQRAEYPVWRWLPAVRWGHATQRGPAFYARTFGAWVAAAAALETAARLRRPHLIDFQAPLHRRLDAHLVRRLLRVAPVAWTIHDVLPPGNRTRPAALGRDLRIGEPSDRP